MAEQTPLISEQHEAILATTFIGLLSTLRHRDGRISTNPVGYQKARSRSNHSSNTRYQRENLLDCS